MTPYGSLCYYNRKPVTRTDEEWAEVCRELAEYVANRQLSRTIAEIATVELLQRVAELEERIGFLRHEMKNRP